jgi:hypothetical protein
MAENSSETVGSVTNTRVYIAFLVILPIALIGMSEWYRRRITKSPIKERPHSLIFSTVGPFFMMGMEYGFVNVLPMDHLYCFPIVMILATSYISLIGSLAFRTGLLYWEFTLTQKKMAYAGEAKSSTPFSEARLDMLKVELAKMQGRSKWMRFGAALSWVVGFIATVITFSAMKAPFNITSYEQVNADGVSLCNVVTRANLLYWFLPDMILHVISMIWLLFKMRSMQDNFYLKQELWYTLLVMMFPLIYIILVGIPEVSPYLYSDRFDYGTLFFLEIPALMLMGVSFGFPIWKSYDKEFRNSRKDGKSTTQSTVSGHHSSLDQLQKDFRIVLEDPQGSELFQKFLQREWSVENILFWKAAVDFRSSFESRSPEERAISAAKIYAEYISENAPLCVNLPYEIRSEVTHKMNGGESTSADLFQKCESEIFLLMMKDSFRRFMFRDDSGYKQIEATVIARRNSLLTEKHASERRRSSVPLIPAGETSDAKVLAAFNVISVKTSQDL